MSQSTPITVRPATQADVPTIHRFIRELAEYEKLAHHFVATEDDLHETLFGTRPYAEVLIASIDETSVGHAIFFHDYSTFLARPGIYIEDIFVLPEYRGRGAGKALLKAVANLALERRCGRLNWSVLDWNTPSIEFYKRCGADVMPDWRICRMGEEQIRALTEGRTK
ncbi:MAG TPA: GNAT family N-acetyltransferase [Tepidisphaeraceae bacterium]|jgi:GNAT superfamily N-acetyltransferase|nr:GNAT family N-acetyltransferase [Tepidisphaeraceae bacterium]